MFNVRVLSESHDQNNKQTWSHRVFSGHFVIYFGQTEIYHFVEIKETNYLNKLRGLRHIKGGLSQTVLSCETSAFPTTEEKSTLVDLKL